MKIITVAAIIMAVILVVAGIYYFYPAPAKLLNYQPSVAQNSKSETTKANQTPPLPQILPTVEVGTKADIGNFLTDGAGMTLYYFASDIVGKSNCTGNCANVWPSFYSSEMNVGAGLNAANFNQITRGDGSKQITYMGWPLYRYSKDSKAGDTNGQGFGGIWFVAASPFYSLLLENNSKAGIYIADSNGKALYMFASDIPGSASKSAISNCTGVCAQNWLPYYAEMEKIVAPSVLKSGDFAEFTRSDGQSQLSYKGYPLYYYIRDVNAGDILGNGLNGIWFLANPQGLVKPAASVISPSLVIPAPQSQIPSTNNNSGSTIPSTGYYGY